MTTPTSGNKATDTKVSGGNTSRATDAGKGKDQNAFASIGPKVVDTRDGAPPGSDRRLR